MFVLSKGHTHDNFYVTTLLAIQHTEFVLSDKGFDLVVVQECIQAMGAIQVALPRHNRKQSEWYDYDPLKRQPVIEIFLSKLKYYRRIFMRLEKQVLDYRGFSCLRRFSFGCSRNVNRIYSNWKLLII